MSIYFDTQDFTKSSCLLPPTWLWSALVPNVESPNVTQHKMYLSHLSFNLLLDFGFIFLTRNINIVFKTISLILLGFNLFENLNFGIRIIHSKMVLTINYWISNLKNTLHHFVTLLKNKITLPKIITSFFFQVFIKT